MSKQLSFVAGDDTLELIEALKPALGARTTAGVLRKSLALLKIATDRARDSGYVVCIGGVNVLLRGAPSQAIQEKP